MWVYWDFARLAQGDDDRAGQRIDAARKALALNPKLGEARLMLGFDLYRMKRYGEAFVTLAQVKTVEPDTAPHLFLTLAYSALQIRNHDEAKKAAEQAVKYAKEPSQRNSAEQLLKFLERGESAAVPEAATDATDADASGQRAEREATVIIAPRRDYLTVRGTLLDVQCKDARARLVIGTSDGKQALMVRDASEILLKNSASSSTELSCGPQKEAREVIIEYVLRQDPSNATIGDVRTVEFLP